MFSDQSAINAHYDTAHTDTTRAKRGEGAYECDVCGKKFVVSNTLKRHLATVHGVGDVKTFQCELCPRVFSRKDVLYTHVRNVHKG